VWSSNSNDPNPPDLIVPPALEEPSAPTLDETDLGYARQNQFNIALQTATTYDNEQLEQLAIVITGHQESRVPDDASAEV
jgi:hypothetical protein